MEQLSGKVAVITGAASGIGLAMAHRFAAEGMRLVLADIEAPALDAAVAGLPSGTEAVTRRCDVSKADEVDGLRDATLEAFGAVHLVCNNAGVGTGGPIAGLPLSDWEWVLGVNLWGVVHGVRAFLPLLQEQGEGHVVNTASAAGMFAAPFMGPYNVSKYGVVALSETMHHELQMAQSPVGVSVLCPSWVKTNIADSGRNRPGAGSSPEGEQMVVDAINNFLATGLEPSEVADAVADAVMARRFWILTHDDTRPAVAARGQSILDGTDPPLLMH